MSAPLGPSGSAPAPEPPGSVRDLPHRGTAEARSQAAVRAARARARRAWRNQLLVVAVLAVLLAAGVWTVWVHSEIRAVRIVTTSQSPQPLPSGEPAAALTVAWHSSDHSASGEPVQQDVVVTYGERTVTGRDAVSGIARWSYQRTDRKICDVVAEDSTVIAIYEHSGLCDEVTALDAGSGQRKWVRTLLSSGTPATLQVSARDSNVLLVTPTATELIEPTGGLDWWYEDQTTGCTTRSAVLGDSGVLMANQCRGGDTLSLRALLSSKARAWTVPLAGRTPLSADALTTVLSSDGRSVAVINAQSGAVQSTVALTSPATAPTIPAAAVVSALANPVEVIHTQRSTLALVKSGGVRLLWQRADATLPTVTPNGLLAAGVGSVSRVDPGAGSVQATYRAVGLAGGDVVDELGRGVLVSGGSGSSAYR